MSKTGDAWAVDCRGAGRTDALHGGRDVASTTGDDLTSWREQCGSRWYAQQNEGLDVVSKTDDALAYSSVEVLNQRQSGAPANVAKLD